MLSRLIPSFCISLLISASLETICKAHSPGTLVQAPGKQESWTIVERIAQGGVGTIYRIKNNQTGTLESLKLFHDPDHRISGALPIHSNFAEKNPEFMRIDYMGLLTVDGKQVKGLISELAVADLANLGSSLGLPFRDKLVAKDLQLYFTRIKAILQLHDKLLRSIISMQAKGLTHNDIKLSNYILRKNGSVVLGDFDTLTSIGAPLKIVVQTGRSMLSRR